MILRYYFEPGQLDAEIPLVLDFCQRTGCREILLFTSSYDRMPSFLPLDQIAEYMEELKCARDRLADRGVRSYLNVMQTLGHVYYPESNRKQMNIQPRVSIDGRVSREGGCPLCPNLRQYLREAYRLYGEFGAELMFVDDDYRYILGGCHCFCDLHLKSISQKLGRSVTRDEVRSAVASAEFEEDALKRTCHEVMRDAMVSLAWEIGETVRSVAPECRIGLMTQAMPRGNFGNDVPAVIKALSGERHRPFIRPQISMYSEAAGRDIPGVFINPAVARSLLGDDVDYYPEIENYYYSSFSKSPNMTFLQMLVQYTLGFDNLALNLFDFHGGEMAFEQNRGIARRLADSIELFEIVKRAVGDRPILEGVHVVSDLEQPWRTRALHGDWREMIASNGFYNWLPNLGMSLGFEKSPHFQLISGDVALAKTDAELKEIMSRGAVVDARALECLAYRGLAEGLDVTVAGEIALDDLGSEWYTNLEINPKYSGATFPLQATAEPSDFRRLKPCSERVRVVSEIRNAELEFIAPGAVTVERPDGTRFAVLATATSAMHQRRLFENPIRQEQLMRLFEWVARRELPVKITATPYVIPYLVRNRDTGERILLLINLSSETYPTVKLSGEIFRNRSSDSITELTQVRDSGGIVKISEGKDEGTLILTTSLEPFGFKLLRVCNEQSPNTA